jgi:anti-sigma-K factor RskA
MSMAEIMRDVADWPSKRQNELAACLLHLRLENDSAWRSEMTRRIDDKNQANWVSLPEWKKASE